MSEQRSKTLELAIVRPDSFPTVADQGLSAFSSLLDRLEEVANSEFAPRPSADFEHQNRLVQVRLGIASGSDWKLLGATNWK